MKIRINGGKPQEVDNVVIYDNDIPVAAAMDYDGMVYFCDSNRDGGEFIGALKSLGIKHGKLHVPSGIIKGNRQ